MNRLLFCFSLFWLIPNLPLHAQQGYEIDVAVNGFRASEAYLAYYYGNKQYIKDTAEVVKGSFTFAGEEPLDGGIYLVVLPPSNTYFELVIDKEQHFSVFTDTVDYINSMKIKGSKENLVFYQDLKFLGEKRKQVNQIDEQLKSKELSQAEKDKLLAEKDKVDQEVKTHRAKLMEQKDDMFYAKVLYTMKEPEIPETPKDANGEPIDPNFAYWHYREHYFDYLDMTDDRLLRTPVLHNKIDQYLERLIPKVPDSLCTAVDFIIDKTRPNDDMFQYFVVNLLNKYANSKIMGMDGVYVCMVEKYYMSGAAWWADEETIGKMTERALAISPTLVGRLAPNFTAQDVNGSFRQLHGVDADYTILYFWDYDCGHCKKVTPQLGKAFDKFDGKGVKIFAVSINGDVEVWKEKIKEYGLSKAINVQDHRRQSGFDQKYDVHSTPRLLILDKDKKILAKQISVEQMDEILSRELDLPLPETASKKD